jgi:hypothetical protein
MAKMSSEKHRPSPSVQGCIDMLVPLVKLSKCLAFFHSHAQKTEKIDNVNPVVLEEPPQEQLSIRRWVVAVKDKVKIVRYMPPISWRKKIDKSSNASSQTIGSDWRQ